MIIQSLKNSILSIGKSLDGPVFIKDYEGMDKTLEELEALKRRTKDPDILDSIDTDMLMIKLGSQGEKNVYFELKNSFLPMYVLHDIRIQHEDYNAQLDFVIITNRFICILETKKLNGDITINNQGEFIRTFRNSKGKFIKKEGMYSPISQNQRHVRILQDMLIKEKVIKATPVISLVVMANPKNIIDFKFAPKEIKQQIVKYDQLTPFLKKMIQKNDAVNLSIVTMQDIAGALLKHHVETEDGIVKKYEHLLVDEVILVEAEVKKEIKHETPVVEQNVMKQATQGCSSDENVEIDVIRTKLVNFRKAQAKEEGIAAYYIFNNNQMEDLIAKMPKSKEELCKCSGFGPVKAEKYGNQIVRIFLGDL